MKRFKNKTIEKGVSLYLTILILVILLAISLGISTILSGQLKMIGGIGKSVVAFYAADTGIEEILYNDNQCRKFCPPLCPLGCGTEEEPCPPGCECEDRTDCPCPCPGCAGYPDSCDGLRDDTPPINGSLDSYSTYEAIFFIWNQISIIKSVGKYQGIQRAIETNTK
jgi:hypothetical protein